MIPFRARRIDRLDRLDRANCAFAEHCYRFPMENHGFSSKKKRTTFNRALHTIEVNHVPILDRLREPVPVSWLRAAHLVVYWQY